MKKTSHHLIVTVLLLSSATLCGGIKLSAVFGNHMVLQQGEPVPVWGSSDPEETIKVTFDGQTKSTKADKNGNWMIKLDALKANAKGQDLRVNERTFKDVLIGEVWICSGQSNMAWTVRGSANPQEEAADANYPAIRHIKVPQVPSDRREKTFNASWQVCNPQTAGNFTAVGYYFGRRLHKELKVPIGLINSSWGGTRIEPWIPMEGFELIKEQAFAKSTLDLIESVDPATKKGRARHMAGIEAMRNWVEEAEKAVKTGNFPPKQPVAANINLGNSHQSSTRLYRGMIHPLVPFAVKGAIWYHGESNGSEGKSYYHKKHGLVRGWREAFSQDDLSFYWVQLANFTTDRKIPSGGDGYARVRDAQRNAQDIPGTGMAVIIDIGETGDIHPKNKQDVGARLAQWALSRDYGKEIVPCGPLYQNHKVEKGKVLINFDHVGSGLIIGKKEGLKPTEEIVIEGKLERFSIAGKDKVWYWANALIQENSVVVSHPEVPNPVAVRYAYSANPIGANLYNREGIPASPFRTDDW